eukprot:TRINITY_DN17184_c0_g1_i2.p1 TRINITY_DN17184_c0_g1~~TRINITY_DN17184_c0_g1_i2.p1  ORF type:complete len:557 (-),score=87.87 TRINITY_DN17184_c0_g1_i2:128-1798(-)
MSGFTSKSIIALLSVCAVQEAGADIQKHSHGQSGVTSEVQLVDSERVAPVLRGTPVDVLIQQRGLLSDTEKPEASSVFSSLDEDKDGSLSEEEFDGIWRLPKVIQEVLENRSENNVSMDGHAQAENNISEHARIPSLAHEQVHVSPQTFVPIQTALLPNVCCVVLAVCMFIFQVFFDDQMNKDYFLLRDPAEATSGTWLIRLGAFLYWVVMPVTMLAFGYTATCEGGTPDLAYEIYGIFLVAHMVIAGAGIKSGMKTAVWEFSMESFPILCVLSGLEHFDMSTDSMFPGTTHACSEQITPMWLESWRQATFGHCFVPLLETLGVDGFALTMFIGGAFIPQFLVLTPFGTCACLVLTVLTVYLWLLVSWAAALALLGVQALLYVGLVRFHGSAEPVMGNLAGMTQSDEHLANYAGILVFKMEGGAPVVSDPAGKLAFISATKLIFENILQLWVQSSAFALAFGQLQNSAKVKALISMCLGLGVAATKLFPLLKLGAILTYEAASEPNYFACSLIVIFFALPVVVLGFGPWLWTIAKIYFAFECDSHIWNLSSGCVVT